MTHFTKSEIEIQNNPCMLTVLARQSASASSSVMCRKWLISGSRFPYFSHQRSLLKVQNERKDLPVWMGSKLHLVLLVFCTFTLPVINLLAVQEGLPSTQRGTSSCYMGSTPFQVNGRKSSSMRGCELGCSSVN